MPRVEVDRPEDVGPLATIQYYNGGIYAEHNMPCPRCDGGPAVLDLSCGVFDPCWACQSQGWRTIHVGRKMRWLLRKMGVLR